MFGFKTVKEEFTKKKNSLIRQSVLALRMQHQNTEEAFLYAKKKNLIFFVTLTETVKLLSRVSHITQYITGGHKQTLQNKTSVAQNINT